MLSLREIRDQYNQLVPLANARGIEVEAWVRIPPTRDRGILRLNWLRGQLGMAPVDSPIVESDPGALPLREIFSQWNSLVPEAQRRGIDGAEIWTGLPPTIRSGMRRLRWLRAQLEGAQSSTSTAAIIAGTSGIAAFAGMTFGVELECIMPQGVYSHDIARWLSEIGVPTRVEEYGHTTPIDHWKIVTDGSLGNYTHGIELVSHPLSGEEGFSQLRKACDLLVAKRVKISKKCGFHVHVGMASESVQTFKNLALIYKKYESQIDQVVAPSRREEQNMFARSMVINHAALMAARTIPQVIEACGQVNGHPRSHLRYRKLNFMSWGPYKTAEFRQHQGTIEAEKAEYWVRLCMRMVVQARQGVPLIDGMFQAFNLTDEEQQYFRGRIAHFDRRLAQQQRTEVRRIERRQATMVVRIPGVT